MSKPPNLRDAKCCATCSYFNWKYYRCKKHNEELTGDGKVCDDWQAEGESDE